MEKDAGILLKVLNADGGITANDFVVQMIADILNKPIALIGMPDVSALGAALLAGLKAGVFESLDALKQIQTDKKMIQPVDATAALQQYQEWQKVINVGI
jgi:glycerol kinase